MFDNDTFIDSSFDSNAKIETELTDFPEFKSKAEIAEYIEIHSAKGQSLSGKDIRNIRHSFENIIAEETQNALQLFLSAGGVEDDFEFKKDELSKKIDNQLKALKTKWDSQLIENQKSKKENADKKEHILDQIRVLLEKDEDRSTFDEFRKLTKEWTGIGAVPQEKNQELWANYHALLDRFYSRRSIFFDLKELDKKKNTHIKEELCLKAESLLAEPSITKALHELNLIHQEFKTIGPVVAEKQEVLWQKLKTVTEQLYQKRKEYFAQIEKEQNENLEKKKSILLEISTLASGNFLTSNEWKEKSKRVLDLENTWKAIRNIPKEELKNINKEFWAVLKRFFEAKNQFYSNLEKEAEVFIQQKQALINEAVALNNAEDWFNATTKIIKLQQKWKEIPSTSSKKENQIYEKFKKECDLFFYKKRESKTQEDKTQQDNLSAKQALFSDLESKTSTLAFAELDSYLEKWMQIGSLNKDSKNDLTEKFFGLCEKVIDNQKQWTEEEKFKNKLTFKIKNAKESTDAAKFVKDKENHLKKKVKDLEGEIDILQNNLGFFARAKNAEQIQSDFKQKIAVLEKEKGLLKDQLKMFRDLV